MKVYELHPAGTQKSFYGKAVVQVNEDGAETLYSYNTPIVTRYPGGRLVKLWDGWTNTTGKHIKAFCGLNKSAFMNL